MFIKKKKEIKGEKEKRKKEVSNLVFYAQSTISVTSGREEKRKEKRKKGRKKVLRKNSVFNAVLKCMGGLNDIRKERIESHAS